MKTLVLFFLTIAMAMAVDAINLVVPNANALVEGGYNNGYPFDGGTAGLHYQQVYDASQFSALGTNGGTIKYLGFRWIERVNSTTINYGITIRFSTTTAGVDNLSTNFASNFGADNVHVFGNTYNLSPAPIVGIPWPFPTVIPLGTGYFYNPTNGNLLLDIQIAENNPTSAGPLVDAINASGDSISRARKANSDSFVHTDTVGMVTEFGVTPVTAPAPRILSSAVSGNNMIIAGAGGASGLVYCVLTSTNLYLPMTNWTCVATNAFNTTGGFVFTNTLDLTSSQQYYVIQIQ